MELGHELIGYTVLREARFLGDAEMSFDCWVRELISVKACQKGHMAYITCRFGNASGKNCTT